MNHETQLDHVRVGSIVIRCHEYDRMFAFWQAALHYEIEHVDPNGGFVILRDPGGKGVNISSAYAVASAVSRAHGRGSPCTARRRT